MSSLGHCTGGSAWRWLSERQIDPDHWIGLICSGSASFDIVVPLDAPDAIPAGGSQSASLIRQSTALTIIRGLHG